VNIADYNYDLPKDRIAQTPAEPRDSARLMVFHRVDGAIEHRTFRDLPEYLTPKDVLVLNRTRVLPVRLKGVRPGTSGKVEVVLIREVSPGLWEALLKPGQRLAAGSRLALENGELTVTVEDDPGSEIRRVGFGREVAVARALERFGRVPLPPYINRDQDSADHHRYQTVYAREQGAIAAPTAGLHFTLPLLQAIKSRGTAIVSILLHVGPGTFQPIRTKKIDQHQMAAEYYCVEQSEAKAIQARRGEGRVVAIGTTTVRVLETIATEMIGGALENRRHEGRTAIFIYPGYDFQLVDVLLTNFHLPQSTLLLLVSAFAGRKQILSAYEEAVRERYRFYSYGDAMLIL